MRKLYSEVVYCDTAYQVAEGCDGLVLVTEWEQFRELDFLKIKQLMKKAILIDGRNLYDANKMKEKGFIYEGIGRS